MKQLRDWTDRLPHRELDATTERMVRLGAHAGGFADRSAAVMSLALRFLNHGRTWYEFARAMTDPTNGISEWFYDLRDGHPGDLSTGRPHKSKRGHELAMRQLEQAWEKAYRRELPKQWTKRDAVREALTADRDRVSAALPSKTRHTRLTIYDALVILAIFHGRYTVSASKRQLVELSGRSDRTVLAALVDLEKVGALQRDRDQGRRLTEAASYILTPNMAVTGLHHSTTLSTPCEGKSGVTLALTAPDLPIWRAKDLGLKGRQLYAALDIADPAPATELARITEMSPRTAYRKLGAMEKRGLAVRTPDGWLRGSANPAAAASEDAVNAAKLTKRRHQIDRHAWQQRFDDRCLPRSGVLTQPVQPENFEIVIPTPRNALVVSDPEPRTSTVSFPTIMKRLRI